MRLVSRKLGWIGIDVGTTTVKIAQVLRHRQGWQLAASAIVPRQQTWHDELAKSSESRSSSDEFLAARSLQQGYRGRKVAATLPMSLCDIHRFDVDLNRESNAVQRFRQTVETATQQSVDSLQCDYWSGSVVEKQPAWTQALTVPRIWTDQLSDDITEVGWKCEAIDGAPLAMARAVGMVHPKDSAGPLAVLDWGSSRATLCIVERGQPTYVRCLKACGLRNLHKSLIDELQVSELDAQKLLEDYGLNRSAAEQNEQIAKLVQEIIAEPVEKLVEELNRSFSHGQYVRRTHRPECLYLLGGGGTINHLESHLSQQLKLKTLNWQLPGLGFDQPALDTGSHCLLASAIALSALAWEVS